MTRATETDYSIIILILWYSKGNFYFEFYSPPVKKRFIILLDFQVEDTATAAFTTSTNNHGGYIDTGTRWNIYCVSTSVVNEACSSWNNVNSTHFLPNGEVLYLWLLYDQSESWCFLPSLFPSLTQGANPFVHGFNSKCFCTVANWETRLNFNANYHTTIKEEEREKANIIPSPYYTSTVRVLKG